jgi:hypothetical protein
MQLHITEKCVFLKSIIVQLLLKYQKRFCWFTKRCQIAKMANLTDSSIFMTTIYYNISFLNPTYKLQSCIFYLQIESYGHYKISDTISIQVQQSYNY